MTRNDIKNESEWNIHIRSQRNSDMDNAKTVVLGFSIFRVQESDGHCKRSCGHAQAEEVLNRLVDDVTAVRLENEH